MRLTRPQMVMYGLWALLGVSALGAIYEREWSLLFISVVTFLLTLGPRVVERWAGIRIPPSFVAAIALFTLGTIFLGEVFDFYNRFWWWDIVMHFGSAIGFGLIGFVIVLMMFKGDVYAAPPSLMAMFAFAFAVSIGAIWEIFEYVMDQTFGLNMQKSGLVDTMNDLIVDCCGAFFGALSGYLYLRQERAGGLAWVIHEFIEENPKFFPKRVKKIAEEKAAKAQFLRSGALSKEE